MTPLDFLYDKRVLRFVLLLVNLSSDAVFCVYCMSALPMADGMSAEVCVVLCVCVSSLWSWQALKGVLVCAVVMRLIV